jgi:hypothetical protein
MVQEDQLSHLRILLGTITIILHHNRVGSFGQLSLHALYIKHHGILGRVYI